MHMNNLEDRDHLSVVLDIGGATGWPRYIRRCAPSGASGMDLHPDGAELLFQSASSSGRTAPVFAYPAVASVSWPIGAVGAIGAVYAVGVLGVLGAFRRRCATAPSPQGDDGRAEAWAWRPLACVYHHVNVAPCTLPSHTISCRALRCARIVIMTGSRLVDSHITLQAWPRVHLWGYRCERISFPFFVINQNFNTLRPF